MFRPAAPHLWLLSDNCFTRKAIFRLTAPGFVI